MEQDERLQTELSLLEAMYPGQVTFEVKAKEVNYSSDSGSIRLRLPDGYLTDQLPEVLFANLGRQDVRDEVKQRVQSCIKGEEALDSIVLAFDELSDLSPKNEDVEVAASNGPMTADEEESNKATVIIWLHHLLNTNKRKQALSPSSPGVSGLTKPGYPGVLLYSGPAKAVHEHVYELRQLNWQAFQVRLESDEEWFFSHGFGVKEIEAMRDVIAEVGEGRKELFMEAMRMK